MPKYDAEFKEKAVKQSYESSKTIKEVAAELKIPERTLKKWCREIDIAQEKESNTAMLEKESKDSMSVSQEEAERKKGIANGKKTDGVWKKIGKNSKQLTIVIALLTFLAYTLYEGIKFFKDKPPSFPITIVDIEMSPVEPEEGRDASNLDESMLIISKTLHAINVENEELIKNINTKEEENTGKESKDITSAFREEAERKTDITNSKKTDGVWKIIEDNYKQLTIVIALLTLFAYIYYEKKKIPIDRPPSSPIINIDTKTPHLKPEEEKSRDTDVSNLIKTNMYSSRVLYDLHEDNMERKKSENAKDEVIAALRDKEKAMNATIKAMSEIISSNNVDRLTPLMIAIRDNRDPTEITAFIKSGEDVNARDKYGRTVLMIAVGFNTAPDIVEVLVENNAEINARFKGGYTALMVAAFNNSNPSVINTLIKAGANTDDRTKDGNTVLMIAAAGNSNPEVITTLIEKRADVNARDKDGWTALMYAAKYNSNSGVITALLEGGAIVDARGEHDMTALMFASGVNSNPEVITALVENGADVNAALASGITVLMIAAIRNSNPDVIAVLIKYGANPNTSDNDGRTALIYAVKYNSNLEVISALLEGGADINTRGEFDITVLMAAALNNCKSDVITTLIKKGSDVNIITKDGFTALMVAAGINSNPEVITVLINNGADVSIRSNEGKNALDYANENENENLRGTDAYDLLRQKTLND